MTILGEQQCSFIVLENNVVSNGETLCLQKNAGSRAPDPWHHSPPPAQPLSSCKYSGIVW